jgi:hypothetical protein
VRVQLLRTDLRSCSYKDLLVRRVLILSLLSCTARTRLQAPKNNKSSILQTSCQLVTLISKVTSAQQCWPVLPRQACQLVSEVPPARLSLRMPFWQYNTGPEGVVGTCRYNRQHNRPPHVTASLEYHLNQMRQLCLYSQSTKGGACDQEFSLNRVGAVPMAARLGLIW